MVESQYVRLKNGVLVPSRIQGLEHYASNNINDFVVEESAIGVKDFKFLGSQTMPCVPYSIGSNAFTESGYDLSKVVFESLYQKMVEDAKKLAENIGADFFTVFTLSQTRDKTPIRIAGGLEESLIKDLYKQVPAMPKIIEEKSPVFEIIPTANFYGRI